MAGRIVCVGGAVQDLTFRLQAAPVPGTSNPSSLASSFGGVARNVAQNLAVLGCDVRLVTAVGEDAAGTGLVRELAATGVDTRHVRAVAGAATAQYAAVIDPAGDLTIGLAAMEVLGRIDAGWLDRAWPEPGGWVFCDTNLRAEVLAHAIERAGGDGTPLVIDAVSAPKALRLPPRLDGIALLSCNRDEAQNWLQHNGFDVSGNPSELARHLLGAGAKAVLVTLGAGGVVAASRDLVEHVPAVPVEVVNVTGAGDALVAGTIAGLIGGDTVVQAAHAGARRAAEVLGSTGSVLPAD